MCEELTLVLEKLIAFALVEARKAGFSESDFLAGKPPRALLMDQEGDQDLRSVRWSAVTFRFLPHRDG